MLNRSSHYPRQATSYLAFRQQARQRMSWRIARQDSFSVRNKSVWKTCVEPSTQSRSTEPISCHLRNASRRVAPVALLRPSRHRVPQETRRLAYGRSHGGIEDGRLELLRPGTGSTSRVPGAFNGQATGYVGRFAVGLALIPSLP